MKLSRAAGAGARPRRRHRLAAAGMASAALVLAPLGALPSAAAATPPQITTVTSYTGTATVTLGHPKPATKAKLSPQAVAYNSANGDEAVGVLTGTGQAHVYLIAGATEPNEYHIQTTPNTFGTLVKGDAYLVAGSGTLGLVADPGATTTTTGGSTSPLAVTNPVAPMSLAFDHSGNLLIAGNHYSTTTQASGVQVVAKATCSTSCGYGYSALGAGHLYSVAGVGMRGLTRTPAISFTFGVLGFGLAVDAQGNLLDSTNGDVLYVNVGTTPVTRYGKTIAGRTALTVAGTSTTGAGKCAKGGSSVPATGSKQSPNLQFAHPYVDTSGNVYLNDNWTEAGTGCVWVLPAATGTVDGMPVTAGKLYSLTGPSTATAFTNGAVANEASFTNPSAVVTDPAGNLVVSLSGTHPAVRVIAESTGKFYGQTMTSGHAYLISGGPTATRTTPGDATGFKFAGTKVTFTTIVPYGITSLVNGAPGDVLLANGINGTTGSVYQITGGPTSAGQPPPTVASISPSSGPVSGGTKVTITGTNLEGSTVDFGTSSAAVTSTSDSSLTVTTPPHPLGPVTVTVKSVAGTATVPDGFTYIPLTPSITSITPNTGSTAGGTLVTLKGVNLTTASAVTFGSGSGTTVHAISSTEVTVVDPPGSGTVTVTLTNPGGTATLKTAFTYVVGTPPSPPTAVSVARAGTGAVKVAWSPPLTSGPLEVTSYTATASPGGLTCKASALTCTIVGLTNGTTYAFTVVATNAAGTSSATPPQRLIPGTPPAAPGTPTAVRGVGSVTVRWTAPTPTASGFPVSGYTVTSSPTARTCTVAAPSTPVCTVATLGVGTSYTFTVTATNVVGTGPASTPSNPSVPEKAVSSAGAGYWEVASDGGIFAFGSATFAGSMGGKPLNAPIVGVAATPTGNGYWEVASDGGLFAFGAAQFYGSMGGKPLNAPIVGMTAMPTGKGYWEVASDGGIFAFGSATFDGSMGGKPLNAPIVGLATTPTGNGYWEVASDGGIFAFGSATFDGSMGGKPLNAPIVGLATTPTGNGYWEVARDGGIFAFGSATFDGSMGGKPLNAPIVGLGVAPTGNGYWEVASDGGIFAFGAATFDGSMGGQPLDAPIVGIATTIGTGGA